MGSGVNRRSLLKQGLTAAGGLVTALALPTRAFAQASSLTPYERRVLDIAAREANFSNDVGSEATSRGAFLTCETYSGKYGSSIRLRGLDMDNSNAHDRAIVMHPAWYAAPDMLTKWGKLGRSEGCFAMDPSQFSEVLWTLSGGHLLFADRIGEV